MFWIVAQTLPQREKLAKLHVERAGFETYLPCIKKRGSDRKIRIVSLFPQYLFVFCRETWTPVMRLVGVKTVIRNGEQPARLDPRVIDEIRSREKGGIVQLPSTPPIGVAGQKVRILRGPFSGRIAALRDSSNAQRQRVLLDFLGRQTTIEINRADMSLDVQALASQKQK